MNGIFSLQYSAGNEDADQDTCDVTLYSVRVDWIKSLNFMGLKEHHTLRADTIDFKCQHSDDAVFPAN